MIPTLHDVAPGDPHQVGDSARTLRDIKGVLADVSDEFTAIFKGVDATAGDVFTGKAAEQFSDAFKGLPKQLDHAASIVGDVAKAVSLWQHSLEDLQRRARNAISRAEVAAKRKAAAEQSVRNAAAQISRLKEQVRATQATEQQRRTEYDTAAATGVDPSVSAKQQSYLDALQSARTAQSSHDAAARVQRSAEAELRSANGAVTAASDDIRAIKQDFEDEARRVARTIRGVDLGSFKNKDFFQKAGDWVGARIEDIGEFTANLVKNIIDLIDAALDGDWDRVLYRLSQVLDALSTILAIVILVLAVVCAPVGGLILAGLVIAALSFATKAALYARGARNPDDSTKPAVEKGDLLAAAIDVGFAAIPVAGGKVKVGGITKTVSKANAPLASNAAVKAAGTKALKTKYGEKAFAKYLKSAAYDKSRNLVLHQIRDARTVKGVIHNVEASSLTNPLGSVLRHGASEAVKDKAQDILKDQVKDGLRDAADRRGAARFAPTVKAQIRDMKVLSNLSLTTGMVYA